MKDKKIIKKIIIGLVVAVAGLFLYSIFVPSQDSTQESGSLSSLLNTSILGQVNETDVALANGEILRILGSVQNIVLDDDIFSNPVFRLLKDSRFSIPNPARIGRPNPFLPSGYDAISDAQQNILQDSGFVENVVTESGSFDESAGFFTESLTEDVL